MRGRGAAPARDSLAGMLKGVTVFTCATALGGLVLAVSLQAAAQPEPPSAASGDPGGSTLVYVSDYVSFVGRDEQGHVAFALDNNRGRDGNAYQAEHFAVLHDERQGWIEVRGGGPYDNPSRELAGIPDSSHFKFQGQAAAGLTVTSEVNRLTLRVDPVPVVLARRSGDARFWMGGAPATLEWSGRTLKGRVIYEYVLLPEFNRLTRVYWGLWKEYQGLYLSVGGPASGRLGDLYVHSQQSEMIAPLTGKLAGFMVLGRALELQGLALTPLERELAWGFFRWPTKWRLDWTSEGQAVSTTLTLSDRKSLGNWVIGGFSMGIVTGGVTLNGTTEPVYGLAELLM